MVEFIQELQLSSSLKKSHQFGAVDGPSLGVTLENALRLHYFILKTFEFNIPLNTSLHLAENLHIRQHTVQEEITWTGKLSGTSLFVSDLIIIISTFCITKFPSMYGVSKQT